LSNLIAFLKIQFVKVKLHRKLTPVSTSSLHGSHTSMKMSVLLTASTLQMVWK